MTIRSGLLGTGIYQATYSSLQMTGSVVQEEGLNVELWAGSDIM